MSAGRKMNVLLDNHAIFLKCVGKYRVLFIHFVSMTMPHDFQQSRLSVQICIQTVAVLTSLM